MTMLVNLNIASASDSHHSIIGRAFSPIIVSEIAKMIDQTTIWSTSPSAMAWTTDVGNVWRKIWSHVWCTAAMGGAPDGGGSTSPTPGLKTFTATSPMKSAIVVTTSK